MTEQPGHDAADQAGDDAEEARRARVGAGLKQAFAALSDPGLAPEEKPAWHKRLIAITNSAKHDLATAEARMERYWADWEAEVGPRPPGAP